MNKAVKLNVDIGLQKFAIGDLGEIEFQPNDPEIIVRFEEVQKNIKEKLNENEKSPTAEDIKEAISYIKEQMNYLFQYDVSSVIFKKSSPLAVGNNGCYVLYNIFEALSPYLGDKFMGADKATMNRAQKRSAEKRKEYTAKYGV